MVRGVFQRSFVGKKSFSWSGTFNPMITLHNQLLFTGSIYYLNIHLHLFAFTIIKLVSQSNRKEEYQQIPNLYA